MEKYKPKENDTIRCSNLMFGCIDWFYNHGSLRTISLEEGLFHDQRVFGPAVARGLIVRNGEVWMLSQIGVEWYKHFLGRSSWKEQASKNYSHYIKILRAVRKAAGGQK